MQTVGFATESVEERNRGVITKVGFVHLDKHILKLLDDERVIHLTLMFLNELLLDLHDSRIGCQRLNRERRHADLGDVVQVEEMVNELAILFDSYLAVGQSICRKLEDRLGFPDLVDVLEHSEISRVLQNDDVLQESANSRYSLHDGLSEHIVTKEERCSSIDELESIESVVDRSTDLRQYRHHERHTRLINDDTEVFLVDAYHLT